MPNVLNYEQARLLYDQGLRWPCELQYYAVPDRRETYALCPRFQAVSIGRMPVGKGLDCVAAFDLSELLELLKACSGYVCLGELTLAFDDYTPGYTLRFTYHRSLLHLNEPQTITATHTSALDAAFRLLFELIDAGLIDLNKLSYYWSITAIERHYTPAEP